jgi:hypothetical protein
LTVKKQTDIISLYMPKNPEIHADGQMNRSAAILATGGALVVPALAVEACGTTDRFPQGETFQQSLNQEIGAAVVIEFDNPNLDRDTLIPQGAPTLTTIYLDKGHGQGNPSAPDYIPKYEPEQLTLQEYVGVEIVGNNNRTNNEGATRSATPYTITSAIPPYEQQLGWKQNVVAKNAFDTINFSGFVASRDPQGTQGIMLLVDTASIGNSNALDEASRLADTVANNGITGRRALLNQVFKPVARSFRG